MNSDERLFRMCLTEPAFNHIKKQISLSSRITYTVEDVEEMKNMIKFYDEKILATPHECSCKINKSWFLPCLHIFAARRHFGLPLFGEKLCPERWKRNKNVAKIREEQLKFGSKTGSLKISGIESLKKLSEAQKKVMLSQVCKDIIFTGSKLPQDVFEATLKVLKQLQNDLYDGTVASSSKKTQDDGESEILSLSNLSIDNIKLSTPLKLIRRSKTAFSKSQNVP